MHIISAIVDLGVACWFSTLPTLRHRIRFSNCVAVPVHWGSFTFIHGDSLIFGKLRICFQIAVDITNKLIVELARPQINIRTII